jgi:uncharacterized membrane protein YebE (DUF533 family)
MPSGGGGGGGQSTNTVQKADPWAGQQPYLQGGEGIPGIFPEAANLYQNNPLQYYQGQTYAGLSPETEMSLQMQANRAMAGSPVTNAAQSELTKTIRGDYLDANNNPYLQAGSDAVLAKVLPQIDARFGASGRGQSGLAARAASQGATDALGGLALQNYNNERTNQMRGMMFAPQMAQQDYADAARLGEVGGVREDFSQQGINDAMQRFQFENMAPWQQLGLYNSMVQGNYGGTTQSSQTMPRRSIGAGVLGGGLAGASAGALLGGANLGFSPMTGAIGGGLGGSLLGGFL